MRVYLDNSATTRPYPEVARLVMEAMEGVYGNPSALHDAGLAAEKAVREARRRLADAAGAEPDSLVFTSGGTESDNMALICGAESGKRRGKRIISSRIEHPAVIESCRALEEKGFEVAFADVDSHGAVVPASVEQLMNEDAILISCMHVNNETGTIQPVGELLRLRDSFERRVGRRLLFHVDAVQSFGKIPLDFGLGFFGKSIDEVKDGNFFSQYCENFNNCRNSPGGADLIAFSAHKIHGPMGSGALYVRRGVNIKPLIYGGGQERGLRSGTENVPAIAGFGLAAKMASERLGSRAAFVAGLRKRLLSGLLSEVGDIKVNGHAEVLRESAAAAGPAGDAAGPPAGAAQMARSAQAARSAQTAQAAQMAQTARSAQMAASPYILNVSFRGIRGEVLLHDLESKGIFVSTGSACSSKKGGGSPVLKAMGLPQADVEGAIRFSLSEFNTAEEIDYAVEAVKASAARLRRLRRFR
ncbi:MAG: cysteine desulfurase [Clostridiales Family XIII bacterium]|jgi:cysteine desulfurase|nr:cysteine desulfurase [Clostridiales Family XIII bacterium]